MPVVGIPATGFDIAAGLTYADTRHRYAKKII